ncbi:MAG: hypothetical protein K6G10_04420 [Butyrivibrio sp.]|nr:hypothetical protein [Butyrivibrio sp.]
MANRFEKEFNRTPSEGFYRVASILLFVVIATAFFFAVDASGKSSVKKQQESLESAIARDIVQCYAIEGRYPPSLDYMKEHYGLTYDDSTFFVDYQPIAANLYPDYTVILR